MLADVNSVNTNGCRKLDVSCCCVLQFRMADVLGRPEPASISWQYIFSVAFSSYYY